MPNKIIYSVLNWGLGHASRSTPIIQELINNNIEVIIASDGLAKQYLSQQFPFLKIYSLPPINIRYPSSSLLINMSYQWPKLLLTIKREENAIKRIVQKEQPIAIISDNRYGCFSTNVKSIFITHQLNLPIKNKLFKAIANKYMLKRINKFNECWIPDYENSRLTKNISSNSLSIPIHNIGPISHFIHYDINSDDFKRELIVVLSGPEPQRTYLEQKIITQLEKLTIKTLIVQGIPSIHAPLINLNADIQIIPYLTAARLYEELNTSKYIICRSGYSSIMDLEIINRSALLIPTPGQTEQEHLAQIASETKHHHCVLQSELDISKDIKMIPTNGSQTNQKIKEKLSAFITSKVIEWKK